MTDEWTLCIDFGTACSKAAAAPSGAWAQFEPDLVRPLAIGAAAGGSNPFVLDSAVFIDEGMVLFGAAALRRAEQAEGQKRQALRSFKTLLSAPDLDTALNTAATGSVDPSRSFRLRDLIVLYLAYLSGAVERAVRADPLLAGAARINRRYAAPAWRRSSEFGAHAVIVRLFAEAQMVERDLGDLLINPEGAPIAAAAAALTRASEHAPEDWTMGMIFEAIAAAAGSSIGLESSAAHVIVVDMGAGTTDIAALGRSGGLMSEVKGARATLTRAGDFIDRILLNLALEGAPTLKTPAQQAELWRSLGLSIRETKEALFQDRKAVIRHNGRPIVIALRDLERDEDFKQFLKLLIHAYDSGLAQVLDRAAGDGEREVDAIAVGGGAGAPFIQALLRRRERSGRLKVTARPATPEWAHAPVFAGNLAPVFPQLAIAIGGALAPPSMLAKQL